MTDDEKLKAIHRARETYAETSDDCIEIDFDPDEISETDEGCWVRGWLWVAREAYEGPAEDVVPGG